MEQSNTMLEQRSDSLQVNTAQSQARVLSLEQEKVQNKIITIDLIPFQVTAISRCLSLIKRETHLLLRLNIHKRGGGGGEGNNGCNLHLVRQEAATVSCILYCFGRENSIFIRENSGKSVNCMIFLATMIKKFKTTMMLHLGISTCCDF